MWDFLFFFPRTWARCDLGIGREPEVTPDRRSRRVRILRNGRHVFSLTFKKCHKAFRNANNGATTDPPRPPDHKPRPSLRPPQPGHKLLVKNSAEVSPLLLTVQVGICKC